MIRTPRLVERSFQRRSVYSPAAWIASVPSMNNSAGKYRIRSLISASVARKLITSPMALPTISMPLASSPQRMFFSSMNDWSMSARVRRGENGAGRRRGVARETRDGHRRAGSGHAGHRPETRRHPA